eukprot:Em0869g2a
MGMASQLQIVLFGLLLVFLCHPGSVTTYRPVVVLHGILASDTAMEEFVQYIQTAHPGTQVLNVDAYNDLFSVLPMWNQMKGVQAKIQSFVDGAPDGVHMICYSQGGLTCRAILQSFPTKVHTFVSLSSPQAGQYGDTDYLNFLFPNFTKENLYLALYNDLGQDVSVGNYWNDPYHQDLYYQHCDYLPLLNNGTNPAYKTNFLNLQQLVLIGGPDDGVITPWESSQFGFYEDNSETVADMKSQSFYTKDSFGLRTLDMQGKIARYTIPGVIHTNWHRNQSVFDCCIEPWLD